jgi:hypothetical protein
MQTVAVDEALGALLLLSVPGRRTSGPGFQASLTCSSSTYLTLPKVFTMVPSPLTMKRHCDDDRTLAVPSVAIHTL